MADVAARSGGVDTRRGVLTNPITLWGAFVLVHLWLGFLCLFGPGLPLGDVTLVYSFWVDQGLDAGIWVGIDTAWVYPIVALIPMIGAHLFGHLYYASTWLSLVMIVDAIAFAVLLNFARGRRTAVVAWWWLGFLLLLGPIAVARIDSFTIPIAVIGMLLLATAPKVAGMLLTIAAWIKVWPAALIAAAVVALRSRLTILTSAVVTSGVIVVTALILGAGPNVLSFITEQTGRGLQIEAPVGTFWMWDAFLHRGGSSSIYYDHAILTYQLQGVGVATAAATMTPLLAIVTVILLLVGVIAIRRRVPAGEVLPALALAITSALILFNKVGSPQFVGWLVVPIVYGMATAAIGEGRSFRVPAILAAAIALLTQSFYPYLYGYLLSLDPTMLLALTLRNLLYVALLGWAVWALLEPIWSHRVPPIEEPLANPARHWPFGPHSTIDPARPDPSTIPR